MPERIDGKYNKILQAAIQVISEKGLDRTSITDIVKQAGIAQGTFYLYFPSKKDLIPAIAENLLSLTLEKIKAETKQKHGFWEIIQTIIDETFELTNSHKEVIILCYSGLAIVHSMEKWETIYDPYYKWLEEVLKAAADHGEIIAEIDIGWTARLIINLIESAAERYYIAEEKGDLAACKKETFSFLQRSLDNMKSGAGCHRATSI
ncbi:TetR family transcriptional regulator [Bacillus aerolatus]|uniref:TetR family transcriptional regulator n=1 Tax=Bacillus aerolatus TaxID=2653354 RepID=A0A6I1FGU1_9BACI|nr:TetR family transcriptional regulator [Bacillus aerolatus]KAB7704757.1 TetR family transcriptional regulator [Bacillus aerolatus]